MRLRALSAVHARTFSGVVSQFATFYLCDRSIGRRKAAGISQAIALALRGPPSSGAGRYSASDDGRDRRYTPHGEGGGRGPHSWDAYSLRRGAAAGRYTLPSWFLVACLFVWILRDCPEAWIRRSRLRPVVNEQPGEDRARPPAVDRGRGYRRLEGDAPTTTETRLGTSFAV